MNAFAQAFDFVVSKAIEGGDTNDPDDPGGLTRFGIAQNKHPNVDVASLTLDGAREIYRWEYWEPCRCEEFPPPLALALFDSAVNQGTGAAVRLLQRALRVDVDGIVGPDTISAAGGVVSEDLLVEFLSYRAARYADGNPKFRRGWFARLFRLQRAAWSLA
jgi:lysozyme family protein